MISYSVTDPYKFLDHIVDNILQKSFEIFGFTHSLTPVQPFLWYYTPNRF